MERSSVVANAAKVIAAKAQRLLADAGPADARGEKKRQRAAALLQIAAELAPSSGQATGADVTAEDREAAAREVYSLAQRRSAGAVASRNEAVVLYEITLQLHYESYWAYLHGLLLESLDEFEAAAQALDAVRGDYEKFAKPQAERCRQRAAGKYDEIAATKEFLGSVAPDASTAAELTQLFQQVIDSIPEQDDADDDAEAQPDDDSTGVDNAALDLAAETAQQFAEYLVDGNYTAAQKLLARSLHETDALALRQSYEEMIAYARDGEEGGDEDIEVCVQTSDADMPDMTADDLAWVYVSISGNGFSEAVTVVVTREDGALRIRELEWGRP